MVTFKINYICKVFLGGTCAESKWRNMLIPKLKKIKCDYFNPVVEDWTPECQAIEEDEKLICDYHLYVITPKMQGVFSIAEAVNDSINLDEGHCIFCIMKEDDDRDFFESERRSLEATAKLIEKNGGKVFYNLFDVVKYLNGKSLIALSLELEYVKEDIETYKKNIEQIKKDVNSYKERYENICEKYDNLIKEILPDTIYKELYNPLKFENDILNECISRLNRPLVQKIIKKN